MKKFVIAVFLLFIYVSAFTQENGKHNSVKPFSIGLGAEFNMNSRENFASGCRCFDYL